MRELGCARTGICSGCRSSCKELFCPLWGLVLRGLKPPVIFCFLRGAESPLFHGAACVGGARYFKTSGAKAPFTAASNGTAEAVPFPGLANSGALLTLRFRNRRVGGEDSEDSYWLRNPDSGPGMLHPMLVPLMFGLALWCCRRCRTRVSDPHELCLRHL
jgi:hypothetical protein